MTKLSRFALLIAAVGLFAASESRAQTSRFDGVTLRVLSTGQPWEVETRKRAGTFEAMTGAKVEFDLYGLSQTAQKVAVELSASSPAYDIVFLESTDVDRFAPSGRLEPLTRYVDADKGYDLADFIPAFTNANTVGGKLYAIPFFAATQILYYRGDLLKEAGFEGPPKTFKEFIAMCAKLQMPDRPCTALRGKPSTSENVWYWTQILYGYGGRFVKDFPSDMTPTVDTPEAVEAVNVYKTLLTQYGIPGSVSAGFDEVVVAMQQGNIAMAIEGAPLAGRILDPKLSKVAGKLGFAVPPGGPKGVFAPFTSQGWAVNAASRNKDAAAAFLLWATSKTQMLDVAANSVYVSVTRQSAWDSPEFKKAHTYDYGYGSFTDAYLATLKIADKDYRLPFRDSRPMTDRIGVALQEAVVGRRTPQEALSAAEKDIITMFRRGGELK